MSRRSILSPSLLLTAASGLIFLGLLALRLDLFSGTPENHALLNADLPGRETWMNIYQDERKIGYAHRRLVPVEEGYDLLDTTFMRLNTMGMIQDLHMRTTAKLGSRLELRSFDFNLRSNLFDFEVQGTVRDATLFVEAGDQRSEIPLDDGIHLSGGVMEAVLRSGLAPGESRTFSVFDPATLARRPVTVTAEGEETLRIMGEDRRTLRVLVDFMGSTQTAWVGAEGGVLRERGLMGITLEQVTQKEAFEDLTLSPSRDLTRLVSVAANTPIENPEALTSLKIHISGIDTPLFLDGGRQRLADQLLTVTRESGGGDSEKTAPEDLDAFLRATPFVESDHPRIRELVGRVVPPAAPPREKAQRIAAWIHENIEKRPVLSVPSALATLKARQGDCNEHAVLMAAMARAAGVPAQIEAGLVYMRGRFYYHAWNVLYLDGWVTVDALMNQIPADVTHIRFVRGEPRQQVDLMGVIGKVKLKIVEKS